MATTDLKALQEEHAGERHSAEVNASGLFGHELECTGMRDWECDDLPESVSLGEELVLVRYPALVDEQTSVEFGYSQKKTVPGNPITKGYYAFTC